MRHRPQKKGSREKEKDRRRLDEEGRKASFFSLFNLAMNEREGKRAVTAQTQRRPRR
jgi:hypothetical protein